MPTPHYGYCYCFDLKASKRGLSRGGSSWPAAALEFRKTRYLLPVTGAAWASTAHVADRKTRSALGSVARKIAKESLSRATTRHPSQYSLPAAEVLQFLYLCLQVLGTALKPFNEFNVSYVHQTQRCARIRTEAHLDRYRRASASAGNRSNYRK